MDVVTQRIQQSLRGDRCIEYHEKTDIRNFTPRSPVVIVVIDASFISLRDILPHIATLVTADTKIVSMVKPQFEAGKDQVNKGIIKND